MLYSAEKGNKTSFRGKVWQLPNRYWRACNYSGQQCSYKTYNEAHIFAAKGKPAEVKPLNEGLKRQQTRYRPELSRHEMEMLVQNLKDEGYLASSSGPNLKTDATDKAIEMAEGVVYIMCEDDTTAGSLRKQLRAAKFKKARNVPAGLSSYVNPALQDIWIRGNVVVLTNGILWNAYTDDGGSIGSGTDRDQIMKTLDRSSWINF